MLSSNTQFKIVATERKTQFLEGIEVSTEPPHQCLQDEWTESFQQMLLVAHSEYSERLRNGGNPGICTVLRSSNLSGDKISSVMLVMVTLLLITISTIKQKFLLLAI
jgi:hypothetical protein